MHILPQIVATTYIDVYKTGRNRPCRFSCVDTNNNSHDYIVKFFGAIRAQIICEYMAVLIGKRLGLNVPQAAIVHVDPIFVDIIKDQPASESLKKHKGPHFGSRDIGPGATVVNQGYTLIGEALEQAINIFAFDMFIQNTDRTASGLAGNPNVLFKRNDLFPIDHELAFSFINLVGGNVEPWQLRNTELANRHIFHSRLRSHAHNKGISFENFLNALSNLQIEEVEDMVQRLPKEWYNERYVNKIIEHCRLVLSNLNRFQKELLEVFV